MRDSEINDLITQKTGRVADESESTVLVIPKPKFNIGDVVKAVSDTNGDFNAVIDDIMYCYICKSWKYGAVINMASSVYNIDEKVLVIDI